jgi:twitching motility protein PilT
MKELMRQNPDVILLSDMRDRETCEAAIQAAETGHLVLGTLHASGVAQAVGRVVTLFPTEAREHVRRSLSLNLQAVLCQKLLPSAIAGVDRVPAVEVLVVNSMARQLIQAGRDAELSDLIRMHEREGMQSFTKALVELIQNKSVDAKAAYDAATNLEELKMLMRGIRAVHQGFLGR